MKLLVITQKVDKNDSVLGFFCGWIEKLSSKFDEIAIICLQKGEHRLPENVKVYSLGKKARKLPLLSRIKYLSNFYRYILGLHEDYDAVFVHMNQEYVILGGFIWKIMRKKIYLWRNHAQGNFLTGLAVWLSNKVFYTSPSSYTAKFKKSIKMPVGIDTEAFMLNSKHQVPNSKQGKILSLGRISPIKNIHLMVEAAEILKQKNIQFSFDIVGDAVNPEDFEYMKKLEKSEAVHFLPAVPNYRTPEIYNSYEIFLNLTPSGSFDKTILEAAACGSIPIVANTFLGSVFDELTVELRSEKIATKIEEILKKGEDWKDWKSKEVADYTLENHGLNALIDKLCIEIEK